MKPSPKQAPAPGPHHATAGADNGDTSKTTRIRRPIERNGYLMEWRVDRYIYQHRLVMAEKLGRPLTSKEIVHHIDFDKTNNHPDNLALLAGHAEHGRIHREAGHSGGWGKPGPRPWQQKPLVPCPICGVLFKPGRRTRRDGANVDVRCCSQECGQQWRYKDAPHGANRYQRGCRCEECRAGNAALARAQRARRRAALLTP